MFLNQQRVKLAALALLFAAPAAHAGHPYPNPCSIAEGLHIPCIGGLTMNGNLLNSNTIPSFIPPVIANQGTTILTVEHNFPGVILSEWTKLTSAQLNAQFVLLGPLGISRLSQAYYMEHGNIPSLQALATAKLTAANLTLFNQAFDVGTAHPLGESHAAHYAHNALAYTTNGLPLGPAAPTVNMTLYEIYTEYLFTEATSTAEALFFASRFAYGELSLAGLIGYKVGSVAYAFGEYLDPQFGADLATYFVDGYEAYGEAMAPVPGVIVTVIFPDETWVFGATSDLTMDTCALNPEGC